MSPSTFASEKKRSFLNTRCGCVVLVSMNGEMCRIAFKRSIMILRLDGNCPAEVYARESSLNGHNEGTWSAKSRTSGLNQAITSLRSQKRRFPSSNISCSLQPSGRCSCTLSRFQHACSFAGRRICPAAMECVRRNACHTCCGHQ